jgi:hypothetical protein
LHNIAFNFHLCLPLDLQDTGLHRVIFCVTSPACSVPIYPSQASVCALMSVVILFCVISLFSSSFVFLFPVSSVELWAKKSHYLLFKCQQPIFNLFLTTEVSDTCVTNGLARII